MKQTISHLVEEEKTYEVQIFTSVNVKARSEQEAESEAMDYVFGRDRNPEDIADDFVSEITKIH